MNDQRTFDPALLKSLFAQLVAACGKQDAAAARLGVSRQRVGQLCSANPEHVRDVPTWAQVWTLEEACGRSVIFAALADLIEPRQPTCEQGPMSLACGLVKEASDALGAVDAALSDGHISQNDQSAIERELDHIADLSTRLRVAIRPALKVVP